MNSFSSAPIIAKKWSYYNDFDAGAAAWTRELIKRGLVAPGEVDERSILEVRADDVRGFTQCHWFCGIAGWSYALRLAGWPDDRPVWTGSPPCQPFSAAGKQLGREDARHLAPHFISLVGACRPSVLFGEQVASAEVFGKAAKRSEQSAAPAWAWLDDLSDRLEAARYAVGARDIPAAFIGAPHIRQRTFFGAVRLADASHVSIYGAGSGGQSGRLEYSDRCATERLADAHDAGPQGRTGMPERADERAPGPGSLEIGLADAGCERRQQVPGSALGDEETHGSAGWDRGRENGNNVAASDGQVHLCGASDSPWRDADWLFCRDGKWRPVIASFIEVAYGLSDRMVLCCDGGISEKEEEIDGPDSNSCGEQELPSVRGSHEPEAVLGEIGGQDGISPAGLLQQEVHGAFNAEGGLRQQEPQPEEGGKVGKGGMRSVRGDGLAARSSSGRKPFQQHPVELADIVPILSSEISLAKLHGRSVAEGELRSLRSAILSAGPMPHASIQDEEAWASLSKEDQDRIKLDFADRFVRVSFVPLSKGEEARVMRLRGYGNAIVPQAAAEFIKAFCAVLEE